MTFKNWIDEFDTLLDERFGLKPNDIGLDMEHLKSYYKAGETPTEVLDWLKEKYRYIDREDFTLSNAINEMKKFGYSYEGI